MRTLLIVVVSLFAFGSGCQGRLSADTHPKVKVPGGGGGGGEGEGSHAGEGEGSHAGEGEGSHSGEGEGSDDQGCTMTIEVIQPVQCPSP